MCCHIVLNLPVRASEDVRCSHQCLWTYTPIVTRVLLNTFFIGEVVLFWNLCCQCRKERIIQGLFEKFVDILLNAELKR